MSNAILRTPRSPERRSVTNKEIIMLNETSSFEEVRQHIFEVWGTKTKQEKEMIEAVVFITGQDFLDFGILPLEDSFKFYSAGFLEFENVDISPYLDDFRTVELSPSFKKACEKYERPADSPPREDTIDDYERAHRFDSDDENIDFEDYRSGNVFFLSETRLRTELKSRDHNWIIYRTPYRPETAEMLKIQLSQ